MVRGGVSLILSAYFFFFFFLLCGGFRQFFPTRPLSGQRVAPSRAGLFMAIWPRSMVRPRPGYDPHETLIRVCLVPLGREFLRVFARSLFPIQNATQLSLEGDRLCFFFCFFLHVARHGLCLPAGHKLTALRWRRDCFCDQRVPGLSQYGGWEVDMQNRNRAVVSRDKQRSRRPSLVDSPISHARAPTPGHLKDIA